MTAVRFLRDMLEKLAAAWRQIWFTPSTTTPLELTRVGLGAALFVHYALATPHVREFWGDAGLMPRSLLAKESTSPLAQSLFFYFNADWQLVAFHYLFLAACLALMLGWRTSLMKWIVLIGQISYDHRNPIFLYGVDKILASLLLILCVAPIGRALSLDRVRAVRAAKRERLEAVLPLTRTEWTGACIRLMQIQMAVLFFYSAVAKAGDDWYSGEAVWTVFTTDEHFNPLMLWLFASHFWLVNIATYGTLFIELAYSFLIWQRATRPFLLAGALFLHAQFGLLMGLFYFSFVMMTGHMAFVREDWLARLGAWWKRRVGAMEMIYDGHCGFCVRSMAWFLAFDGLNQIGLRDFRRDPSPVVSDAALEKALYLVLPDGRALPGFEAYRHVVLRVPGLWWQVPFFYVPVLSRLVGRPLYNWIAANRGKLSALLRAPRKLSRLAPLLLLALLAFPDTARAAIKKVPYGEVQVVIATPVQGEDSFAAFRKTLGEAVARRDMAALFALVAPSFVWTAQGALTADFDPGRDALHNFKVVFGFRQHGRNEDGGVKDGPYWDTLAQFAADASFYSGSDKVTLLCGPLLAEAADAAALERAQQTLAIEDDGGNWVFTTGDVPVAKAPGDTGPPIARLGKVAVPVISTHPPAGNAGPTTHYEVLLPAGTTGWIAAAAARPLVNDRLCYTKTRDGSWAIAVFDQGEDEN